MLITTVSPLEEASKLENITSVPVSTINPFSTDIPQIKTTLLQHTSTTTLTPTQTITSPTNVLDLKVREELLGCNKRKLFYEFKTQPVIPKPTTSSINHNINKTVAETACLQNNSVNIPRLEIIAESPVDVHFRLCPTNCNKQHEHNCKYFA